MTTKRTKKPKPTAVSAETYELATAKLESSGLTWDDAEVLGIKPLEPIQTTSLHPSFKAVPSLQLPYLDPRTGGPLSPNPHWPAFYRLRYLKTPTDFASVAQKKPARYVQEPGSGVCAYFPHFQGVNWPKMIADVKQPIIITEGEFKAAKATKEGFPTIGLGGVHNFKSAKAGVSFLPELDIINWVKRNVYIAFDSDFRSNPNICNALNELAEMLYQKGATPHLLPLPDVIPNGKTGLDDFLIHEPATELGSLISDRAELLTISRGLWKLNEQVTYIRDPGLIIVNGTQQKLSPTQFTTHAYSSAEYAERVVRDNGSVSLKPASAAQAWLKWPLRREAGRLTYRPGCDELIESGDTTELNVWSGWGVEPKKGDIEPFNQLINHLFTEAEPSSKTWFLRWLAFPLQYPGIKLFSAAVVHGTVHGTGKSLLGYTMAKIYGKNFKEINQNDLHGSFNSWAENKQFILGDEITGSDNRRDADMLKSMITRQKLDINQKFIPTFEIPDCINYLFTSNQPDAFFLEDKDRRFYIHEVVVDVLPEEFYVEYNLWLDSGGAAALFYHLKNLDLGDFNPAAPAPRTAAKDRMIEITRSDLGSWVRRLLSSPGAVLKVGSLPIEADLFTNKQLLQIYDPDSKTKVTANGLGRELRRAGCQQVLGGAPVRIGDEQDRYYAVRNIDKWLRATPADVKEHLEPTTKPKVTKKAKY